MEVAPGKYEREIGIIECVSAAQVAAEQDSWGIEQTVGFFAHLGELPKQPEKQHHLLTVGVLKVLDFVLRLPVMTEVVISVGCIPTAMTDAFSSA